MSQSMPFSTTCNSTFTATTLRYRTTACKQSTFQHVFIQLIQGKQKIHHWMAGYDIHFCYSENN